MTVKIGRVTSVFTDPQNGRDKRVRVTVKVSPSETHDRIVFSTNMKGLWMVPAVGDHVEVYEIGDGVFAARTPQNGPPFSMPDLGEGDFCLRLGENTEIKLSRQDDGTVDMDLKATGNINVTTGAGRETNVSSPKVNVTSEEVVVTAPSVKLGGDNGQSVARVGDSVESNDSLTGTETGTITSGSDSVQST